MCYIKKRKKGKKIRKTESIIYKKKIDFFKLTWADEMHWAGS